MYRDDNEALFARAEALQREVDELREALERERKTYQPKPITPPPVPKRSDWWKFGVPEPKRVTASAQVPLPTDEVLAEVDARLDRIGEPARIEDVVRRLQRLDQAALERVSELVDELIWNAR